MRWVECGRATDRRRLVDGTSLLASAWTTGYWRIWGGCPWRAVREGRATPPALDAAQAAAEVALWVRAAEGL